MLGWRADQPASESPAGVRPSEADHQALLFGVETDNQEESGNMMILASVLVLLVAYVAVGVLVGRHLERCPDCGERGGGHKAWEHDDLFRRDW